MFSFYLRSPKFENKIHVKDDEELLGGGAEEPTVVREAETRRASTDKVHNVSV